MREADPSNMYQMIQEFPEQFGRGFDLLYPISLKLPINKIVVAGMGGSALPADLVNCAFSDTLPKPLIISRTYTLDTAIDSSTLFIAVSYSGNTEETISAYKDALAKGAQTMVLATGGNIIELAIRNGSEYVRLPKDTPNFQPRMASGLIFGALTGILIKAGWLPQSAEAQVRDMAAKLESFSLEGKGRQLGPGFLGTIPLIYISDTYWPVARISKIKLNENSKIPAFWNVLPELNHNEMVGFSNTKDNYRIIIFRDPEEDARVNARIEATANMLRSPKVGIKSVTIWDMVGTSKLEKIFSTLVLMDWASYYLALEMGIDPTPVQMVEDFKAVLQSK